MGDTLFWVVILDYTNTQQTLSNTFPNNNKNIMKNFKNSFKRRWDWEKRKFMFRHATAGERIICFFKVLWFFLKPFFYSIGSFFFTLLLVLTYTWFWQILIRFFFHTFGIYIFPTNFIILLVYSWISYAWYGISVYFKFPKWIQNYFFFMVVLTCTCATIASWYSFVFLEAIYEAPALDLSFYLCSAHCEFEAHKLLGCKPTLLHVLIAVFCEYFKIAILPLQLLGFNYTLIVLIIKWFFFNILLSILIVLIFLILFPRFKRIYEKNYNERTQFENAYLIMYIISGVVVKKHTRQKDYSLM